MPKRLVITADDFGLSVEVNDAVEEAYREGVLSAASLMVGGPAADDAVRRARSMRGLKVGLHLALVEAEPMLSPARVPHLVDASGWLRSDTAAYGTAVFFRRSLAREIDAEIEAQFAAFGRSGLALDHVNAHRHFHLHPTVASSMIRVGRRYGMKAVRLPREPIAVVRAIEPGAPRLLSAVTAPWIRLLGRRLRRAGLMVPDQVFGLAWSGAMTGDRLKALIDRLPEGLTEIYTHPATGADFKGAAAGYRYAEEFTGLLEPRQKAAVRRAGALLGGFMDALA